MEPFPDNLSPKPPLLMEAKSDSERSLGHSPATAAQVDETQFPQGQCRYILMVADLKGQRCGCVSFSHNKAMPGASCECGHLACFHLSSADVVSPGKNKDEIEVLKRRVQVLEQQADTYSDHRGLENVVHRLSQVEDNLDKHQEDTRNEVKGTYKHISAAWQLVEQLQQRLALFEENQRIQSEQLLRAGKELEDLRNRNLELLEAEEMLEERVEKLESIEALPSPATEPGAQTTGVETLTALFSSGAGRRRRSSGSRLEMPLTTIVSRRVTHMEGREVTGPEAKPPSGAWTIHVSILPSKEHPFPFEKDTNAYKRCLSRGLQRMVVVDGADGEAFVAAVTKAFKDVLGFRAWEPLQARLCDARRLEGLPMLRPLTPELAQSEFDATFIRQHCAVCDSNGRMESMYVTVRNGGMPWGSIRRLPIYLGGLEECWEHDRHLDAPEAADNNRRFRPPVPRNSPGQSAVVHSSSTACLKRDAAEMQASSHTSGICVSVETDATSPRNKVARTYMPKPELFEMRREMEAAL